MIKKFIKFKRVCFLSDLEKMLLNWLCVVWLCGEWFDFFILILDLFVKLCSYFWCELIIWSMCENDG